MNLNISIVILAFITLHLLGGAIYIMTSGRVFIKMYHDFMGWHLPDYSKDVTSDKVNAYAICKHCGKEIIRDSQGNWF